MGRIPKWPPQKENGQMSYSDSDVVAIVNLQSPVWTDMSMPFDLDELGKHPAFAKAMTFPVFERSARMRAGYTDAAGTQHPPERQHPLAIVLCGLAPAKEPANPLKLVLLGFAAFFGIGFYWTYFAG